MEISSNRLLPYSPVPQTPGRAAETAPFSQPPQAEQEQGRTAGELLAVPQDTSQGDEAQLDYRQLVMQARVLRQFREAPQEQPGGEAYRMGEEPLKVQQALGAYRETSELQESGAELMPRLDDYV